MAIVAVVASSGCGGQSSVGTAPPPTPSAAAHATAADAFIALSRGDASATVPWNDSVTYYLGDALVGVLTRDALPGALRSCPPGTSEYEGRSCPVSPVETVATAASDASGVVVETSAPDTVGCARLAGSLAGTAGLVATSVRPAPTHRDCFSDFAVTLFTDETGRVVVVQFALSGP